jgi:hypothetical protein
MEDPIRDKSEKIIRVVPVHAHLNAFVFEARRIGDAGHRNHDVVEVTVLLDQLECFFFVKGFACNCVAKLEGRDNLRAVQTAIIHCLGEGVHVFGIPARPQGCCPSTSIRYQLFRMMWPNTLLTNAEIRCFSSVVFAVVS